MPIYASTLLGIAPQAKRTLVDALAPALDDALRGWPKLRQAHFLAQAAHETDSFRTLEEYGGPTYWKRYEGRKDLGNVHAGDGVRYHGRGIFQLTGRANYEAYGRKLGVDLIGNPGLAAEPAASVRIAVQFWKARGLDAWADRDDVEQVTRKINGGTNGLAERKAYLKRAKAMVSPSAPIKPTPAEKQAEPVEEVPAAPIAPDPPKRWWESTTILATITTAAGGVGAAIKGAIVDIDTPWEFAGLALFAIPILGGAFWIIRERLRKEPK